MRTTAGSGSLGRTRELHWQCAPVVEADLGKTSKTCDLKKLRERIQMLHLALEGWEPRIRNHFLHYFAYYQGRRASRSDSESRFSSWLW
jgi:hypothetical protein